MKCPAPERRNLLPQQIADTAHHFARRLVCKREQQDPVGRNALLKEERDTISEGPGLA